MSYSLKHVKHLFLTSVLAVTPRGHLWRQAEWFPQWWMVIEPAPTKSASKLLTPSLAISADALLLLNYTPPTLDLLHSLQNHSASQYLYIWCDTYLPLVGLCWTLYVWCAVPQYLPFVKSVLLLWDWEDRWPLMCSEFLSDGFQTISKYFAGTLLAICTWEILKTDDRGCTGCARCSETTFSQFPATLKRTRWLPISCS